MAAQLIVQATSDLDEDYVREIMSGVTVREIIDNVGPEFGYNTNMVASINNVQVVDYTRSLNDGDVLAFRIRAKERG